MKLHITEAAFSELKNLIIPPGKGVRIDAELGGSCFCTVGLQLMLDEPRRNDQVIQHHHLTFYIDRLTQRYVGEELTLDFDPDEGFCLTSSEETLGQGMKILN